ncbi:MAG TPA: hypothetical protein PKH37_08160 [Alphaproteobacteria bacterium]|nr:hypothetical protein [Alphaproteobacteria bacterium]
MPIKKHDLRQCLLQKFRFEEVPGSKHEAVSLFVDDKKVATTRFSRAGKDISDQLLRLIAREIWVQLGYLKEMYDCTKSRDDYLQHLQNSEHIQ